MLSKAHLLQFLVGLASMNDTQLVADDRILPADICAPEDRPLIREAAHGIRALIREFSYLDSPEFAQLIAGKSAAVASMQRKIMSDPVRRSQLRARFRDAVQALLASDEAYRLAAASQHPTLDRLRIILGAVQNEAA